MYQFRLAFWFFLNLILFYFKYSRTYMRFFYYYLLNSFSIRFRIHVYITYTVYMVISAVPKFGALLIVLNWRCHFAQFSNCRWYLNFILWCWDLVQSIPTANIAKSIPPKLPAIHYDVTFFYGNTFDQKYNGQVSNFAFVTGFWPLALS